MATLWHGRFEGGPADELMAFTVSLPFDQRLAFDDLVGSPRPRARVWCGRGCSRRPRRATVLDALDHVEAELRDGDLRVRAERRGRPHPRRAAPRRAGRRRPAAKLHTGRSRNDQVATDVRLFMRELGRASPTRSLGAAARSLARPGRRGRRRLLPGYTHLQRAQPVLLAHHLLAYAGSWRATASGSPRCGAAPTSRRSAPARWPARRCTLDRRRPPRSRARRASENSLDAVSDRDCAVERSSPRAPRRAPLPARRGDRRSGPPTSSASAPRRRLRHRLARSCRRRRTPTSPSWPAARPAGSSATSRGCSRRSRACRSPTTATCRRTRSRCSTALDQVRSRLTCHGRPARHVHASTVDAMRAAADSPTASATDLAEWLVEQGCPFRDAHASSVRSCAIARRRRSPRRAGRRRTTPRPRGGGACWARGRR